MFDQPILNILFRGRVSWLPITYNAHFLFDYPIPLGVKIAHFTGYPKPWMAGFSQYEPAFYLWLVHGACVSDRSQRMHALLRVTLRTPLRLVRRHTHLRKVHKGWVAYLRETQKSHNQ